MVHFTVSEVILRLLVVCWFIGQDMQNLGLQDRTMYWYIKVRNETIIIWPQ